MTDIVTVVVPLVVVLVSEMVRVVPDPDTDAVTIPVLAGVAVTVYGVELPPEMEMVGDAVPLNIMF
mgnify:CR=1 FL=1